MIDRTRTWSIETGKLYNESGRWPTTSWGGWIGWRGTSFNKRGSRKRWSNLFNLWICLLTYIMQIAIFASGINLHLAEFDLLFLSAFPKSVILRYYGTIDEFQFIEWIYIITYIKQIALFEEWIRTHQGTDPCICCIFVSPPFTTSIESRLTPPTRIPRFTHPYWSNKFRLPFISDLMPRLNK